MVAEYFVVQQLAAASSTPPAPPARLPETAPTWVPATLVDLGRRRADRQVRRLGPAAASTRSSLGVRCLRRRRQARPGARRRHEPHARTGGRSSPRRPTGRRLHADRHRRRRHQHRRRPHRTATRVLAAVKTRDHRGRHDRHRRRARRGCRPSAPSTRRGQAVMIGTTHFINALVEARGWPRPRRCGSGCPPPRRCRRWSTGPSGCVEAIGGHAYLCHGGHEFDGRPISPLDPDELRRHAADIAANGVRSVAVSSVFSPVNTEFEAARGGDHCRASCRTCRSPSRTRSAGSACSSARTRRSSTRRCASWPPASSTGSPRRSPAPASPRRCYLSQNDGTLMDVDVRPPVPGGDVRVRPDELDARRGVAVRAGHCAVVDVGGTTTDVGVLHRGFPREATTEVDVGRRPRPTSACPTCCVGPRRRQPGSRRRHGRDRRAATRVGYRLTERGAGVRR